MLNNMKIGNKLMVGFGLVLLLLLVVGGTGYWGIKSSTDTGLEAIQTDAQIAENGSLIWVHTLGMRRFEKDLFLNIGNKEKEADYLKKWKEQRDHYYEHMAELEKVVTLAKDKDIVKNMKKDLADYEEGFNKVKNQIEAGQIKTSQEGNLAIGQYKEEMHRLEKLSEEIALEGQQRLEAKDKLLIDFARHTTFIMVVTILVGIFLSLIIGIVITRSIVNPLGVAVGIANKLSAGDLLSLIHI